MKAKTLLSVTLTLCSLMSGTIGHAQTRDREKRTNVAQKPKKEVRIDSTGALICCGNRIVRNESKYEDNELRFIYDACPSCKSVWYNTTKKREPQPYHGSKPKSTKEKKKHECLLGYCYIQSGDNMIKRTENCNKHIYFIFRSVKDPRTVIGKVMLPGVTTVVFDLNGSFRLEKSSHDYDELKKTYPNIIFAALNAVEKLK